MAQILTNIYDWYRDLMDNQSDPRVADWPMMSSPFPTLGLCIFYAYFSKSLAPKLMEKRKPMDLRNTLVIYNLFQTIFSTWIFYEYLQSGWGGRYSFRCQPVDYSDNPLALRMARTCWWYYVSKFTEFFDTLFFILRKKTQHVSTLHVIHHGCMPFSVWMGMKFAPGGHSTFFAMLNSFVHIVMYFYYMVAALGPQYQKYIWWKKYLTAFQMAQFVAIFTHQFQLLFTECDYPKGFMVWIGLHGIMFLFLFSDFYKQAYNKRRIGRAKREAEALLAKSHANGKLHNGDVVNNNQGACMFPPGKKVRNKFKKNTLEGYLKKKQNIHHRSESIVADAKGVWSNDVEEKRVTSTPGGVSLLPQTETAPDRKVMKVHRFQGQDMFGMPVLNDDDELHQRKVTGNGIYLNGGAKTANSYSNGNSNGFVESIQQSNGGIGENGGARVRKIQ